MKAAGPSRRQNASVAQPKNAGLSWSGTSESERGNYTIRATNFCNFIWATMLCLSKGLLTWWEGRVDLPLYRKHAYDLARFLELKVCNTALAINLGVATSLVSVVG